MCYTCTLSAKRPTPSATADVWCSYTDANEKPQTFLLYLEVSGELDTVGSPSAIWGREGYIRWGRKARSSVYCCPKALQESELTQDKREILVNQRKQRLKPQKTEIEVNSEFFTVMRGQRWMLTGYALTRHMEKVSKEQSSNNRIWAPSQRGLSTHLVNSGISCSWWYGTTKSLHGFRTGVEKFMEE